MTQPWWPGSGEPPAPQVHPGAAPWMPQPRGPQGRPQAHGHPQQATPWAPPPTTPATAVPAGQPTGSGPTVSTVDAADPTTAGGVPGQRSNVPGLGFATFLLVVGTLAFAAFVARDWVVDWGMSVTACVDGGGAWECVSNHAGRTRVLAPILAALASLSLARGAGVERQQGRGIGWLYVLLGLGVVGLSWAVATA
jgi:hypothetical protein